MSGWTDKTVYAHFISLWVIAALIVVSVALIFIHDVEQNKPDMATQDHWGGNVPMEIRQVYDRDTGVYYAVTEQGGICIMREANGDLKLVDSGSGINTYRDSEEKAD